VGKKPKSYENFFKRISIYLYGGVRTLKVYWCYTLELVVGIQSDII